MHYSVLLKESVDLLNIQADGVYVDGTFGRGGHSRAILEKLNVDGKLFAFDKDPEAINFAKANFDDSRFQLIHDSFSTMRENLNKHNIGLVDGILLDLGISSPQVDTPERGFSFRFDAMLDMRMDNTKGMSAADFVNNASEEELSDVFWKYGEERFSRRIAKEIIKKRVELPITTTKQLAELVASCVSFKDKGQHPATRVFQAIRIYVNNELGDLEVLLEQIPALLKINARIVVISFHSLEDRIVKNYFAKLSQKEQLPRWVMSESQEAKYKVIAKKIKANSNELQENSRSRSAIMRVLERIDE